MLPRKIRVTALFTTLLIAPVTSSLLGNLSIFSSPKAMAQSAFGRQAQADRLFNQGREQVRNKQLEAAIQSYEQALAIYREIKDRKGEGWTLTNQGLVYFLLLNKIKVTGALQLALAITQEIEDSKMEAIAKDILQSVQLNGSDPKLQGYFLVQESANLFNAGKLEAALQPLEQALSIFRQVKDREGEAIVLIAQGGIYMELGDKKLAIEVLEQGLAIAIKMKDSQLIEAIQKALLNVQIIGSSQKIEADILYFQGFKQSENSQFNAAIITLEKALAIYQEIKDPFGEAVALSKLGDTYNFMGNYTQAKYYQEQALAVARKNQDKSGEAHALNGLGMVYSSLGDYAKAIEYQQKSLAMARNQSRGTEAAALGNLGFSYFYLGEYTQAINYFQQSLVILRETKYRKGEQSVLNNLGAAYLNIGDNIKAIEYLQQSLTLARKIPDRQGELRSLGNLGLSYMSQGDYQQAIIFFELSLSIAQEIKDRQSEGLNFGNLGRAYHLSENYQTAIAYQKQYLNIAREIGDRNGEANALQFLGYIQMESGNLKEAENYLRASIEVKETLLNQLGSNDSYKISMLDVQADTYRQLQKALVAQNKTNEALEISERSRARAFVEILQKRLLITSKTLRTPSLERKIQYLQKIAKQQNATLVEYSIIDEEFNIKGRRRLNQSELYIWVIKPNGEITFRKADLKHLWQKENTNLNDLVLTTRDSIGVTRSIFKTEVINPVNEQLQKKGLKRLHQLLIKPIADLLPTNENQRVIFIPQDSLFLVPFPALQDENDKYLIEKHTILTAPSIQVLDLTRQIRQRVASLPATSLQSALIVGNPTMPKVRLKIGEPLQQLRALPGAEKEVKTIASLLKTQPLIGKQATKSSVLQLLPKARIIHLATHGLFDDIQGLNSALALAPSAEDDGLLTAEKILDLQLNAELVVLSACDTGRGRITGDGVIGLSRSLISAGVSSVMVSLWSVPDAPTASLMTEFYQNLQKNPDKAQALRQAMLTTMKQRPNPRDWAAFTLIGEAE